ncbi:MAG: IS110 family transposase [Caulobacteraceae bacterium]|nr:IS110 family transposase [Caulobacteraceae bacterium]
MGEITRVFIDTSKQIFQLHGVDAGEAVVVRKTLKRSQLATFFGSIPPTVVGLEACGASHHWARVLGSLGHEVRLVAPQHVKAYVRRNKNDARDAEGGCEAMSRPTMTFVPVKTVEDQAVLMLVSLRDRLVRQRTQVTNAIRGHASEFGLVAPTGLDKIDDLLARVACDETLPVLARELFAIEAQGLAQLQARLKQVDTKLMAWHRADETSRRLAQVPGIGPIGATLLRVKTPAPEVFKSGRQYAAWMGLTPKDHSTAGKTKLGVITRAGDEALRAVLVSGAMSVIRQARTRPDRASPWLIALLERKAPKEAAVALANKMARIAWKLMITGQTYAPGHSQQPGLKAA